MAVTKDDLNSFINFVDEKLKNGGVRSLVELAGEWEAGRQQQTPNSTNRTIQIDPRTLQKLAEAFPEDQDKERFKRALARRGGVTTAEMLGKAMLAAIRAGRP